MGSRGSGRYKKKRHKPAKKDLEETRLPELKGKKVNKALSKTHQKLARQKKVAEMVLHNPMPLREMAKHFDVSYVTIRKDLIEIERRYVEESTKDIEIAKQYVIRRLEYVLKEAHNAWEKSKTDQVSLKTKEKEITGGKSGGGTEKETSESRKQTPGDIRYLQEFKDAAIEIAKYHGVDKLDGSHNVNVKITMPNLPAEYAEFGLTPDLPEEDQKKLTDIDDADFSDIEDDEDSDE